MRATKITKTTQCPCGCGGVVSAGKRYAGHGCATRGRSMPRRQRTVNKSFNNTLFAGRPARVRDEGVGDSWWVGKSRQELHDEAERRTGHFASSMVPTGWEGM